LDSRKNEMFSDGLHKDSLLEMSPLLQLANRISSMYLGCTIYFTEPKYSAGIKEIIINIPLNSPEITVTTKVTGVLPVPNGGTGLTSLTAGYIPFGNGTSAFGSSSNLYWDNTNSRLGIGTITPGQALDIHSTGNTLVQLAQMPRLEVMMWR
jgi:hypothetical protein